MRLNPDCIRDILLTIEEVVTPSFDFSYPKDNLYPRLSQYTEDEVAEHLKQCNLSGFLFNFSQDILGIYYVEDLTPQANEFLNNIRNNTVWVKIKKAINELGVVSMNSLITLIIDSATKHI